MEGKRCECKRDVIEVDRCIYLDLIALESRVNVIVDLLRENGYMNVTDILTIIGTRDATDTAIYLREEEERRMRELSARHKDGRENDERNTERN